VEQSQQALAPETYMRAMKTTQMIAYHAHDSAANASIEGRGRDVCLEGKLALSHSLDCVSVLPHGFGEKTRLRIWEKRAVLGPDPRPWNS
jgi:hypothetical protein